jgi:hypothetical protein
LGDYGVSEAAQSVHPIRYASGDAADGWLNAPPPHRFKAFRRPASDRHCGEQFFTREWLYSVNVAPHVSHRFGAFVVRVPSSASKVAWHWQQTITTVSGFV